MVVGKSVEFGFGFGVLGFGVEVGIGFWKNIKKKSEIHRVV